MRRLEKDEIRKWKERLQQPMTPDKMANEVNDLRVILGPNFHVQSLDFVRDAWVAARFSQLRNGDSCRLWPKNQPDFEMTLNGVTQLFEVVEALSPNRKRGDEYRELMNDYERLKLTHCPSEEIDKNELQAVEMLKTASEKKADPKKNYDPTWGLVIYWNPMIFGEDCDQKGMREATKDAGQRFQEVWILWQDKLYRPWSYGDPTNVLQQYD